MNAQQQTKRLPFGSRTIAAFTLVEIAISLAVIAFALVAIIGVLPTGLQVQRDNREETIINQDALVLANAIRNGAHGVDDLTNYVMAITVASAQYNAQTQAPNMTVISYICPSNPPPTTFNLPNISTTYELINGERIVGLLSTPKYIMIPDPPGGFFSNQIIAYVRAISGSAVEKFPQDNPDVRQDAFGYRVYCENQSIPVPDVAKTNTFEKNFAGNLHELRLNFRYPLSANGNTGNGRLIFRFQVGGTPMQTNDSGPSLYFFQPTIYANVP